ncbi:hypothetical protein KFZ76_14640 [Methylovulum psychrotolerans]|uniref:hypothetical protein n=1 Tax=Methylovulum psychrotolerans TaxID=1704499 RepID=UPI001BFF7115|nr:hypothetical protein [Methylovulum psychrotolerans]MBT9098941.1 hypothetical protein [Methylovulum psychrotolerans]
MAQTLTLYDEYGVIYQAMKILPHSLKISFLEVLAELENEECYKTKQFPKTRLHKITGIQQAIYRADIDKVSGWRLHVQYVNRQIHLKDIIEGQQHDKVIGVIKSKKSRYQ